MTQTPTVGLLTLHYCTSRMMDVPLAYWPMMPNEADLASMYRAEKRVRACYAADQHRAKSDPWRHIRQLPDIFDASGMDQNTYWEFRRNAEVDQELPDRPRLGFGNAWAVMEARALPPYDLGAQQHREGVQDYGKKYELESAVGRAQASGKAEDVAAAEAELRKHKSWMMRRQIIHLCEDLRERLSLAQWAEDSDTAKRLAEKLNVVERLVNTQRLLADAREKGDEKLQETYAENETQNRKELEFLNLRWDLEKAEYATVQARATGDVQRIAACAEAEAKLREQFRARLGAKGDEPQVGSGDTAE